MKNKNKLLVLTVSLFIISIIYTILVKYVDVNVVGSEKVEVGFSTLNKWFYDLNGVSDMWYHITKYLGIIPFSIVAYYGIVGLMQLIKTKSITKVDKRLIYLGIFYVLMLVVYVLFEKVIINYRPVLEDGVLEASYPSSHTMLAICICLSSLLISKYYIKKNNFKNSFNVTTILLMVILVVGRTLSGYHWLSDIIGGIIISLFLVSLFYTCIYEEEK